MKRNYFFGTVFAVALGVSVAAQSQSGQTGSQPQSQTQGTQTQGTQNPPAATAGTQGTTPTRGTTGSQGAPGVQGTTGSQIQNPVPGTNGQTPTANQPITITGCLTPGSGANAGYTINSVTGAPNGAASYTLLGGDQTAMRGYGSSRVEVIGTLDQANAGASGAVGTSGRAASMANPPASGGSAAAGGSSSAGSGGSATAATGSGAGSVTGAAGAGTAGAGTAGSIASSQTGATTPPPNFHVTSVRQVPGSCGGN